LLIFRLSGAAASVFLCIIIQTIMDTYETFRQLHQQQEALLLGNAWNVHSARLLEQNGFKAIATSSTALSYALGYDDGEGMSFAELLYTLKRMVASVRVPVSADIEFGYSATVAGLLENIDKLHDAGVVGINIEDSVVTSGRQLITADAFCRKLDAIRNHCIQHNIQLFVNARTDTFLLDVPARMDETLSRLKAYTDAGADGIFVPCVTATEDIRQIVDACASPVNVLSMPGLAPFTMLSAIGVKRISMGNFAYDKMMESFAQSVTCIQKEQSFESLFV
jgi:2-methylisocitrate lyase-like PEP mutase family enzyme